MSAGEKRAISSSLYFKAAHIQNQEQQQVNASAACTKLESQTACRQTITGQEIPESQIQLLDAVSVEQGAGVCLPNAAAEEWISRAQMGQSFLAESNLISAEIMYRMCTNTAEEAGYSNTAMLVRIHMQQAVIQVVKGNYDAAIESLCGTTEECMNRLRALNDDIPSPRVGWMAPQFRFHGDMVPCGTIVDHINGEDSRYAFAMTLADVSYHLSVALTRKGLFAKAMEQIRLLYDRLYESDSSRRMFAAGGCQHCYGELKFTVKLCRLKGLILAHIGEFSDATGLIEAAEQKLTNVEDINISSHDIHEHDSIKPHDIFHGASGMDSRLNIRAPEANNSGLRLHLLLTKSEIYMLRGWYRRGLKCITSTMLAMERDLGAAHPLSLEASCIQVKLLAYNGRLEEVRSLCFDKQRLMTKYLGEKHIFSYEIRHALVFNDRLHAYPGEALCTSKAVCQGFQCKYGTDNQQSIRYEIQLGAIHVWVGNYVTGEALLAKALSRAEAAWGLTHHWVLRGLSEQALGQIRLGRLAQAEDSLAKVLKTQLVFWNPFMRLPFAISVVGLVETAIEVLRRHMASGEDASDQEPAAHPDILFTLETWAACDMAKPDSKRNANLAMAAQRLVWDLSKLWFGATHVLTLQAALNFAAMTQGDDLATAPTESYEIYKHLEVYRPELGLRHPTRLRALGILVMRAICIHGIKNGTDDERLACLSKYSDDLNLRLRRDHPEALCLQMSVLAAVFVADDYAAYILCSNIVKRLRQAHVRKERALECVLWEEKLAMMYRMLDKNGKALEIYEYLEQDPSIKDDGLAENMDGFAELKSRIVRGANEARQDIRKELQQLFKSAEDEFLGNNFTGGAQRVREAMALSETLHGGGNRASHEDRLAMAVALWESGNRPPALQLPRGSDGESSISHLSSEVGGTPHGKALKIVLELIQELGREGEAKDQTR